MTKIGKYNVRAQQNIEAVQIQVWQTYDDCAGYDEYGDEIVGDTPHFDPPLDVYQWLDWHLRESERPDAHVALYIKDKDEWVHGKVGDYLVKDVHGYATIIAKADFEKVYQELSPEAARLTLIQDKDVPADIKALFHGKPRYF